MTYIKKFVFASDVEETGFFMSSWQSKMACFNTTYPFHIFPEKALSQLDFDKPITILYGGNGSSKTTALNIISEKLGLGREALYNKRAIFGIF